MTHQLELPTGESLRDAGTKQVLENNRGWQVEFENEAFVLLQIYGSITSEDVTERLLSKPTHPNAIGAAMRAFTSQNGLVVKEYRKSTRPSRHAGLLAVWAKP